MTNLQVFDFEEQEVRTQIINDEPWFVGKDVADILGYSNTRDALSRHVYPEDKTDVVIHDGRQNREMVIINESGMYALVFGSKLENAKKFKRWVTNEVLPSIRKTGVYHANMSQEDIMIATLEHQKEIKERLNNVSDDVEELKNEIDLSRYQKAQLSKLVRSNVMAAVGGKKSNAYKQLYRVAISEHWRAIKDYFEVASYEEIPKIKFDEAMEIAGMWQPSMELAYRIKTLNAQTELEV